MVSSAQNDSTRQARSQAPRNNGRHHGRIVSHAPGRMRVRIQPAHRDPTTLKEIEQDLASRSGVQSVSTDPRTGSVLVHYDRLSLSKDDVSNMLVDVGIVALDLFGADDAADDLSEERETGGTAPHSSSATSILDAVTDLDSRISRMTGGKFDLKLMVPAGLGLLALRQISLNGFGLGQVPGYVLLWYTFDSFYKLHQRKTAALVEKAAQ